MKMYITLSVVVLDDNGEPLSDREAKVLALGAVRASIGCTRTAIFYEMQIEGALRADDDTAIDETVVDDPIDDIV